MAKSRVIFVGISLLAGIPCSADIITVNWDGSGDYTMIQAGINAASNGDTVLVADGTYYENLQMKNGVTLIGSGADVTTIDGGTNGHVVSFNLASGSISGFTITNSGDMPRYLTGVFTSQCTVTIENNVITDNYRGITLSRTILNKGYGLLIHRQQLPTTQL